MQTVGIEGVKESTCLKLNLMAANQTNVFLTFVFSLPKIEIDYGLSYIVITMKTSFDQDWNLVHHNGLDLW